MTFIQIFLIFIHMMTSYIELYTLLHFAHCLYILLSFRHSFFASVPSFVLFTCVSSFSSLSLLDKAFRFFWVSLGSFTSVAKPTISRNHITCQVTSTSHHSKPCRAEYWKAWWLLCQPSPCVSNPNTLNMQLQNII